MWAPWSGGNKRLGFTATVLFLHRNGQTLSFGEDEAYDLVIAVAERRTTVVLEVAASLCSWSGRAAG